MTAALLAVLALALLVPDAAASPDSDRRWTVGMRLAEQHSPPSLCGPVRYRFLRLPWQEVLGVADIDRCIVIVNARRRFSWPTLCLVLIHERHHIAGVGHSRNPRSFMHHRATRPHRVCRAGWR